MDFEANTVSNEKFRFNRTLNVIPLWDFVSGLNKVMYHG